jgi:hypothetical protein
MLTGGLFGVHGGSFNAFIVTQKPLLSKLFLCHNNPHMNEPTSGRIGRPPKPPEERLVQKSVRLPPALWEKIERNGLDWLRAVIKRAKERQ